MRRFPLVRLVLLAAVVLLPVLPAPGARAGDEGAPANRLTPEQVARMVLLGSEGQQVFVAQYLERADAKTLRAVQARIRELVPKLAAQIAARGKAPEVVLPAKGPVTLVTMEARLLDVDVGQDFDAIVGLASPAQQEAARLLDTAQTDAVLRAIEKSEGVRVVTAPRVSVFDGQRASVSVLNQHSYIRDYDIQEQGERWIADPVVGVVQDGVLLDLHPVLAKDGKQVTLDMDLTWADLAQPIAERQVILRPGAKPVTIQLPELDVGGVHRTATLPLGHALLVSSAARGGTADRRVRRYLLVSAKTTTLDAAELKGIVKDAEARAKAPEGKRGKIQPAPGIRVRKGK